MAQVNLKEHADLAWRIYYPKWLGINAEVEENDRWYVKIRRYPSRKQALEMQRTINAAKDEDGGLDNFDSGYLTLMQFVKGPYNLEDAGQPLDDLLALLLSADSVDLYKELRDEVERQTKVTEEQEGNSDGQSGGDTTSAADVSPDAQTKTEKTSDPADAASTTPEDSGAQRSTTQSQGKRDRSKDHSAPESGKSTGTSP